MLKGYSLRDYTWKDWLLMALSSSLMLQVIVTLGATIMSDFNAMDYETMLEEITRVSINGTVYGTLISLPLTMMVIQWRKIPLINRRQVNIRDSFILPGLKKEDWKFLLKYIPLSYVLYTLGSMIVAHFFGATEAVNQLAVESLFDYIPAGVMFLMIVVVAPIAEELLFRGIILFPGNRLETSWTRTIISALLFGLVHGPTDVYSFYTYVGMGFIFSYAAKKTQTVEAAMVYHFLNNLLGFIVIMSYR